MRAVKVFYWLGEPNFGDMLNIDVCQKLFSVDPIETNPKECEATFIGSTLDDFLYKGVFKFTRRYRVLWRKEPIKVWGSGFITGRNNFVKRKYHLPETYFRRFDCFAVRGRLSLDRLKKIDKRQSFDKVVLGDPGLLAPKLLPKMPDKKYRVGLIPHHMELGLPIWEYIRNYVHNSTIINVDGNVEDTIRQIAQCDVILSSAMHGLIVADAFDIPNARLLASDMLMGGDYKFNDYYSTFGIDKHRKIDLHTEKINDKIIATVESDYISKKEKVEEICSKLIKAFPYK